jgi:hypothetical protein
MRSIRLIIVLSLFLGACHKKQQVVLTPVAALPPAPPPASKVPDLPVLPPPVVPALPVTPPVLVSPLIEADRAFAAGNYDDAAHGYEEYLHANSSGKERDRALFYWGLTYLARPMADWQQGTTLLKKLIEDYPGSPLKVSAMLILTLHSQVDQLSADNKQRDQKIKQLTTELDRLKRIDAERRKRP